MVMHVLEVSHDRGIAYVVRYSDHKDICSMDGRVKQGQACLCPMTETLLELPLDKVQEGFRDPLPDGEQRPWRITKDVE